MLELTMQQIKQHIEQSEYTRRKLITQHNLISSSIDSFNKANELSSSPLFLTKLSKLAKEQKEISNEIKTFDEAINTLVDEFNTLQKKAVGSVVSWTKQVIKQQEILKWV